MRISPQDIRQQQFTVRMFRGFEPQEVDAFLDDVAEDYEAALKEVTLLREQLATHEERSRSLADREKSLQETLVLTQRLVEEMKANAKREAELLVEEAETQAEKQVEGARGEEARIRSDILALKRVRRQALEEVRATLERYQRLCAGDLEALGDAAPEG